MSEEFNYERCRRQSEDIKELQDVVFGNGKRGLDKKVLLLEEQQQQEKEQRERRNKRIDSLTVALIIQTIAILASLILR